MSLQFGVNGDVALRRHKNGALRADAKYFQADAFMVGNVALDDYIEQTIRKRMLRHFCLHYLQA